MEMNVQLKTERGRPKKKRIHVIESDMKIPAILNRQDIRDRGLWRSRVAFQI